MDQDEFQNGSWACSIRICIGEDVLIVERVMEMITPALCRLPELEATER